MSGLGNRLWFWLLCGGAAPPSCWLLCLNPLGKHANHFLREIVWNVIGARVSAIPPISTIGEHTPAQCAAPAQIRSAVRPAETWQRWEVTLAEASRIEQLTQADSSIVHFEMRVHQCLDLRVADICPSHSPIAAATPTCVWWSPLLLITPSVPEGAVALSCIGGKALSSPKSTLSIVILPVVAAPSLPVSPSG
jgi:hypothetical protein